jgi:hypothetical protein
MASSFIAVVPTSVLFRLVPPIAAVAPPSVRLPPASLELLRPPSISKPFIDVGSSILVGRLLLLLVLLLVDIVVICQEILLDTCMVLLEQGVCLCRLLRDRCFCLGMILKHADIDEQLW